MKLTEVKEYVAKQLEYARLDYDYHHEKTRKLDTRVRITTLENILDRLDNVTEL